MFLEALGLAVVRFCIGGLRLFHSLSECLVGFLSFSLDLGQVGLRSFGIGLGLGQVGVGVLQLIGGFVDGTFEVGVFLAQFGEVGLQRGELLGLLRRRDGGESLLEFGVLEDDLVIQLLDLAL